MVQSKSIFDRVVDGAIYLVLGAIAVSCLLPFVYSAAVSLSGKFAVSANLVMFWPIDFTLDNYRFILGDRLFLGAFGISVARVMIGVTVTLTLCLITAYPLSLDHVYMPGRTFYKGLMLFGMMFSVGLIPFFVTMRKYGLYDNWLVLILPGALDIFNTILIINYFRGLPVEMWEAARLDGASHWDILWKVFVPISLPVIATVTLFCSVGHWNSWFDGVIFIEDQNRMPLQSYLFNLITSKTLMWSFGTGGTVRQQLMPNVTPEGMSVAMLLVAAIPVMLVYPFVQRYFLKGLTLGSVKE
jgi:putative aldouronate transport system permease protein